MLVAVAWLDRSLHNKYFRNDRLHASGRIKLSFQRKIARFESKLWKVSLIYTLHRIVHLDIEYTH